MPYDKEKITQEILEAIEKEEITFFDDICLYVLPSRRTLYEWGLHNSHDIKEALDKQKMKFKKTMRRNWIKSENATLQISAYKLMATPEELASLTMQRVDTKSDVNVQGGIILQLDNDCHPIQDSTGNTSIQS